MTTAANPRPRASARSQAALTAVDLFCGAGGLTQGLRDAGFAVVAAVDNAPLAVEAYRLNHPRVHVVHRDIRRVDPGSLLRDAGLEHGTLDLLAGCPPCQGFSTMRTRRQSVNVDDPRNGLVAQFARFAEALHPRALMMENVPGLAHDRRLRLLVSRLKSAGYHVSHAVLDAADYGVPQRRRRFVLIGSREDEIAFARPARRRTVRDVLAGLGTAGASGDPLHDHGEQRSQKIYDLIRDVPPNGGSRIDLGPDRQLACHDRTPGWYDVYGRMAWDEPGPTITSGCINPSKGRFLHPEENRAITLREAALLQSFPVKYKFPLHKGKYHVADLIGNALPPRFVAAQARVIRRALQG